MNNPIYTSSFKDHLKSYVELKQAIGYKFKTEADHLKRFDNFIVERYPDATLLTKEIVLEWCRKKTYEAQENQCARASIIRQFGKYLDSIGIRAYILPKGYYPAAEQYTPYIYTTEELTKFFAQTDQCQYCLEAPNRHLIMPVVFRTKSHLNAPFNNPKTKAHNSGEEVRAEVTVTDPRHPLLIGLFQSYQ